MSEFSRTEVVNFLGQPVKVGSSMIGRFGKPGIFNTDQGSQFTSFAFTTH